MVRVKFACFAAAFAAAVSLSSAAHAIYALPGSLDGKTVTFHYGSSTVDDVQTTDRVVVGPGAEIDCATDLSSADICQRHGPFLEVDFVSDSVTVRFLTGGYFVPSDFNGFRFDDLDFGLGVKISSVLLDTNIDGLDDSRIAFGDDHAWTNLSGVFVDSQSFFSLVFNLEQTVAPVSAPAALGVFGLGLMGLAMRRRRR